MVSACMERICEDLETRRDRLRYTKTEQREQVTMEAEMDVLLP